MKRIRSVAIFLLCSTLAVTAAAAASFEDAMREALALHEAADDYAGEKRALDAYLAVREAHPGEWLPSYWAAWISLQVYNTRREENVPEGVDFDAFVHRAQGYLDRAWAAKSPMTKSEEADFHVLQAVVHRFHGGRIAQNDEQRAQFAAKKESSYGNSMRADPMNPQMQMITAIELIADEDSDFLRIHSALGLLNRANEVFEAVPDRALSTYWAKDMVGFWRGRAEARLAEFLDDENG